MGKEIGRDLLVIDREGKCDCLWIRLLYLGHYRLFPELA
jgi:hypothetical protein